MFRSFLLIPRRQLLAPLVLCIALGTQQPGKADDLTNALDGVCGKALANLSCTDVGTAFPEALGGVVGVLQIAKSKMSGVDDCNAKLNAGSSILAQASQYLNVPGVPVNKIGQCACGIVYSNATCSGEVEKVLAEVNVVVNEFFAAIGLGSESQPPENKEKEKSDYYAANYAPLLDQYVYADETAAVNAMYPVTRACVEDWSRPLWVSDPNTEICGPFYRHFFNQLDARKKIIQDQLAAEAQAKADAWQKLQDAATDNARKIAMSWAKIKYLTFTKQCSDKKCVDDVGFLAFAYYGQLATGMQRLDSSNTQTLVQANAQFDPLLKGKIAESANRKKQSLISAAFQLAPLMAIHTKKAQHYDAALNLMKLKLRKLGVKNPESVMNHERLLRRNSKLVAVQKLQ